MQIKFQETQESFGNFVATDNKEYLFEIVNHQNFTWIKKSYVGKYMDEITTVRIRKFLKKM